MKQMDGVKGLYHSKDHDGKNQWIVPIRLIKGLVAGIGLIGNLQ